MLVLVRNLTLTLPKIASSNTFTNFALAVGLYMCRLFTLNDRKNAAIGGALEKYLYFWGVR